MYEMSEVVSGEKPSSLVSDSCPIEPESGSGSVWYKGSGSGGLTRRDGVPCAEGGASSDGFALRLCDDFV